jgi:undecaprenyl-diphosphatase
MDLTSVSEDEIVATVGIPTALGLAAAFGALTAAVVFRRPAVDRFDDRIKKALARRRTERLDFVMAPLSMLATQEPLIVQALVAFVMTIATIGGKAAAHFACAGIGAGILNEIVKHAVARPRPAGPHLIRWFRGYSFPSGDLLTATAIYLTIAFIVGPYLPDATAREVLFAIIAIVVPLLAICRVYVGVHHPSDVVGGMLLGAAWAVFVSACFA